jgi:hypothetical protein
MKNSTFKLIRFFFGIYMIILAIRSFIDLQENKNTMIKYIDRYENDINAASNYLKFFFQNHLFQNYDLSKINLNLKLEKIKDFAEETLIISYIITILGGLLMMYGYSISFAFIFYGLLIELIFIHNIYYFKEEKMKVNVLKMISIFAGLMHVE